MYVVIFGGLGFVFGDQWKLISSISDDISAILVLLILLVLLVVTLLVGKRGEG